MKEDFDTKFIRFITSNFQRLCVAVAFLIIIGGVILGFGTNKGVLGALLFGVLGAIVSVITFGPLFLLIENNKNISEIKNILKQNSVNKQL